jgi:hypothetical protein
MESQMHYITVTTVILLVLISRVVFKLLQLHIQPNDYYPHPTIEKLGISNWIKGLMV